MLLLYSSMSARMLSGSLIFLWLAGSQRGFSFVMVPADVWMVSSMWTGPLSKTEAQITRGLVVVIWLFTRSSSGLAFSSSCFFLDMPVLSGCRQADGMPRLVRAVPHKPVLGTTIVSVSPARGPAGISAV